MQRTQRRIDREERIERQKRVHDNYAGLARNSGGRERQYKTTYPELKLSRFRSGLKSCAV